MNNIKSIFFFTIGLAAFVLMCSACSKITDNDNTNRPHNTENSFIFLSLNASITNTLEPATYNPPLQNEGIEVFQHRNGFQLPEAFKLHVDIRNLMLFQYDNTGQLIHTQTIGDLNSLNNIPIKLAKGFDHKVVFISNAPGIDWSNYSQIDRFEQLKQLQYDYASITNDAEVPLVGCLNLKVITDNLRIPELILKRIAAKVALSYTDINANYQVKHISLMNVPRTMFFLQEDEQSEDIFPRGTTFSHTIHPQIFYAENRPEQMVWYMPANCRGNNGSASSLKDKTEQTAPDGQGQFASYLSIYCENTLPNAVVTDGVCSIYLGANDPKDYNVKANCLYNINITFNGKEIPDEDPRVDIHIGDFSFAIDIIDDDAFLSHKITKAIMDLNGRKINPLINLIHVHGNKYRVEGNMKLEHRDNELNHISFYDNDNQVLSGTKSGKTFYLEGDVYRRIAKGRMHAYFSGLFCGLGNGTEAYPYEVCSPNTLSNIRDLALLGKQYNRHVKQVKDVDLLNHPWHPIPSFYLNFDGNHHLISNLNITNNNDDVGLFATISNQSASIKNVTIASGSISGYNYVGAIAGRILTGVNIDNCINYASIHGWNNVGGICGEYQNYNTFSDCKNYGFISGNQSIGGIAGIFRANNILNCENYGDVSAFENAVGGIMGVADSDHIVTNCLNRGFVSGASQVGGIEGYSRAHKIIETYNCGDIRATSTYAGGLIGQSGAGGPEFHKCYNHAAIHARGTSGGIAGKVENTIKLYNVYHIGEITLMGNNIAGGICGEAQVIETDNGCYTACYPYINGTYTGTFGHIAGISPNHHLNNTFHLKDPNGFGAVGKGNQWNKPNSTEITDHQLRGLNPIVVNGQSNYILSWLNTSQQIWLQETNHFPYLIGL